MKYICSTCGQQITGWPLSRPHMYETWCSTKCLIEYENDQTSNKFWYEIATASDNQENK